MNIQLIESLVETIHTLSDEEQTVLWQKLDYAPISESILLQKIDRTLPPTIQQRYSELRSKLQAETLTPTGRATIEALNLNRAGVKNIRKLLIMANLHPPL